MDEIMKMFSYNDIEKMKMLLSIIPEKEQKEIVTLRVFIEEYKNIILDTRSAAYLRSVNVSLNHLVKFLTTTYGKPGLKKAINSISIKDVEKFLVYLQQKAKKGYAVYFRNLKAAFNKAKEWGYVNENYFVKVKLPKKQKVAPKFLDSRQLTVISNQIKSKIVKDVVWFAFYTGMRLDEIVNLEWKNVDLENGVITVGDEEFVTKGRMQRFIPMTEEIVKSMRTKNEECRVKSGKEKDCEIVLLSMVGGVSTNSTQVPSSQKAGLRISGNRTKCYVFCKESGKRFTGDYFSKRFKRACIAAGSDKGIHFHSLRHSFASNLVQKGVPLYTIKELLGHSSISTTEIYSHLNMESLRDAVAKIGTRDEGQGAGTRTETGDIKSETGDCRQETGRANARIFRINE